MDLSPKEKRNTPFLSPSERRDADAGRMSESNASRENQNNLAFRTDLNITNSEVSQSIDGRGTIGLGHRDTIMKESNFGPVPEEDHDVKNELEED